MSLLQQLPTRQYSCLCTDSEVAKVTTDLKAIYDQLDEDSLGLTTQLVQYSSSEKVAYSGRYCNNTNEMICIGNGMDERGKNCMATEKLHEAKPSAI